MRTLALAAALIAHALGQDATYNSNLGPLAQLSPPDIESPTQYQMAPVARTNQDWFWKLLPSTFDRGHYANGTSGDPPYVSVSDMPAWMQFDPITATLSGHPKSSDIGLVSLSMTSNGSRHVDAATGLSTIVPYKGNTQVKTSMILPVSDVNTPTLHTSVREQLSDMASNLKVDGLSTIRVPLKQDFNVSFSTNTFVLGDSDSILYYNATLAGYTHLPDWLHFDNYTVSFSGTAPDTPNDYQITLVGSDLYGYTSVTDTFHLLVSNNKPDVHVLSPLKVAAGGSFSYSLQNAGITNKSVSLTPVAQIEHSFAAPVSLDYNSTSNNITGTVSSLAQPGTQANISFSSVQNDKFIMGAVPITTTRALFSDHSFPTVNASIGKEFSLNLKQYFKHADGVTFDAPSLDTNSHTSVTNIDWLHWDANKMVLSGTIPNTTGVTQTASTSQSSSHKRLRRRLGAHHKRGTESSQAPIIHASTTLKSVPTTKLLTQDEPENSAFWRIRFNAHDANNAVDDYAHIVILAQGGDGKTSSSGPTNSKGHDGGGGGGGNKGGVIAGATVGALAGVAALIALVFLLFRWRRRDREEKSFTSYPAEPEGQAPPPPVPEKDSRAYDDKHGSMATSLPVYAYDHNDRRYSQENRYSLGNRYSLENQGAMSPNAALGGLMLDGTGSPAPDRGSKRHSLIARLLGRDGEDAAGGAAGLGLVGAGAAGAAGLGYYNHSANANPSQMNPAVSREESLNSESSSWFYSEPTASNFDQAFAGAASHDENPYAQRNQVTAATIATAGAGTTLSRLAEPAFHEQYNDPTRYEEKWAAGQQPLGSVVHNLTVSSTHGSVGAQPSDESLGAGRDIRLVQRSNNDSAVGPSAPRAMPSNQSLQPTAEKQVRQMGSTSTFGGDAYSMVDYGEDAENESANALSPRLEPEAPPKKKSSFQSLKSKASMLMPATTAIFYKNTPEERRAVVDESFVETDRERTVSYGSTYGGLSMSMNSSGTAAAENPRIALTRASVVSTANNIKSPMWIDLEQDAEPDFIKVPVGQPFHWRPRVPPLVVHDEIQKEPLRRVDQLIAPPNGWLSSWAASPLDALRDRRCALPDWLHFDLKYDELWGIPTRSDIGEFRIVVVDTIGHDSVVARLVVRVQDYIDSPTLGTDGELQRVVY